MRTARARAAIVALLLLVPACGDSSTADSTPATVAEPAAISTTTSTAATVPSTIAAAPSVPSVVGIQSGRGDDGSLEVAIWTASDPFDAGDYRVIVGTDADESYPGTGDPVPHLEGYLQLTPEGSTLFEAGEPIAMGADLVELASWGYAEGVLRVFFIGTTPPKAGVLWVSIEVGGSPILGGTAGVAFDDLCSARGSGLDLTVPGEVADGATPCRYP